MLNRPLAEKLRAAVGSEILLRVGQRSDIPADSPLGRKTATVQSRRLRVAAIIPAVSLGRFGIRPTQQLPLNAFVSLEALQQILEQPGNVNAILVAGRDAQTESPPAADAVLAADLKPTLTEMGISIRRSPLGYFNLTSDRMLLEEPIEQAAMKAFADRE